MAFVFLPKIRIILAILVLALGIAGFFWLQPFFSPSSTTAHTMPTKLSYSGTANGPYVVRGTAIVDASGNRYMFHGVGRDGLEFNCSGDSALDRQQLAFMGPALNTTDPAAGTYWGGNTVRLPLSEGFWLKGAPGHPCTASQYQSLVKQTVDNLTSLKLNVILDLQWVDAGGASGQGGSPAAMADTDSIKFWQQVATQYAGYNNVLFELFSAPHAATSSVPMWQCWLSGCQISNDNTYSDTCKCYRTYSYMAVGMQTLVNTVRSTGASNVVLVGGLSWGYDLSQLPQYQVTGSNVAYDTHPYPYPGKMPSDWDQAFGNLTNSYAIISTESGQYDCKTDYMSQLLDYFDAHYMGWLAWSWAPPSDTISNAPSCNYPQLITGNQGTPASWMGQYIYQRLRSYASYDGPLNKTWYFAEGRVAKNFTEDLSLINPDPLNDCTVSIKYLLDTGSTVTKTVTVPYGSRITESVNNDLGTRYVDQGVSVSAIVTVDPTTCDGIIAERPLYYSYQGINSNSDIMGSTSLSSSFYFADVPTGANYVSFLSILNTPDNADAHVTATYYLAGKVVNKQTVTVSPGQRGTISPNSIGLPAHVSALVTSDQPVMVERPMYFKGLNAGNAHSVSGGSSMVGAPASSNDWLFSEGYTGAGFQEYLAIANLDSKANTMAKITIQLQFSSGNTTTFHVNVNPFDQLIWDVNKAAPNKDVSVEVTSQGASVVVQRQLYFHYKGTTQGGNDMIGLPGPTAFTNTSYYVFAEGFAPPGYDEWLTLQNPTAQTEGISLYLVNGNGKGYTPGSITLPAHSRQTVDISSLVRLHMYQSGESTAGYEVSLLVQSVSGAPFVAERPFYINLNNGATQGGTDVFGYNGS